MAALKLFTEPASSAKMSHGLELGFADYVMYLAPAKESGREVCPYRTAGCTAACLFTAGRGAFANVRAARIRKTSLYFEDRAAFVVALTADLLEIRRRHVAGQSAAVRLNGTSDIPWERLRIFGGQTVMAAFPDLTFYDYTKNPTRFSSALPSNYSLTFSLADGNDDHARAAIAHGGNLAVVFAVKPGAALPSEFWGRPVVDGDLSDARYADPLGVVVGLRAKGKARQDRTGFVRAAVSWSATRDGSAALTAIVASERAL